jgi:TRAP-type mannitol/chloroaromatic compound transport system substrate-binding protein
MRIVRSLCVISVLLLAAAGTPADAQAPAARTQWKMQSSWPANDFHQVNPKGLVEKIAEMTGGRLRSICSRPAPWCRRSRCSTP